MHCKRIAVLETLQAYLTLVQRIHCMLLLQMQLILAHAAELQLTEVAVHRLLHLAEALMSLQTGLLIEHLVAGRAHMLLLGDLLSGLQLLLLLQLMLVLLLLLWCMHACVVCARRALILKDASTGRAILLHITVHFCKEGNR